MVIGNDQPHTLVRNGVVKRDYSIKTTRILVIRLSVKKKKRSFIKMKNKTSFV